MLYLALLLLASLFLQLHDHLLLVFHLLLGLLLEKNDHVTLYRYSFEPFIELKGQKQDFKPLVNSSISPTWKCSGSVTYWPGFGFLYLCPDLIHGESDPIPWLRNIRTSNLLFLVIGGFETAPTETSTSGQLRRARASYSKDRTQPQIGQDVQNVVERIGQLSRRGRP